MGGTAMSPARSSASSRRLIAWFAAATLLPLLGLAWLGWKIVDENRTSRNARHAEQRDQALALAATTLRRVLAEADERLTAFASGQPGADPGAALPAPMRSAALVSLDRRGFVGRTGALLPFYPLIPDGDVPAETVFAPADHAEFHDGSAAAIAALRPLAQVEDPAIRAEALLRLARNHRRAGDVPRAAATYRELARLEETRVAGMPAGYAADDFVLAWTTDGKHLLFGTDRNGDVGLWAQAVVDRKPDGVPTLIKGNIGSDVRSAGMTKSGALHLGIRTRASTIEIASIDLATGKRGVPTRPIRTVAEAHRSPDWSRDGKVLIYASLRRNENILGIRSMDTGAEREVHLASALDRVASWINLAPDGSYVTYGRDLRGRYGIFRIDAHDGRVTPIIFRGPEGRAGIEGFFWSPDGPKMYYRAATAGPRRGHRARRGLGDRTNGRRRTVQIDDAVARWTLVHAGPDGHGSDQARRGWCVRGPARVGHWG